VTSQGREDFVLQSANTPGASNALPRVGPIVISEIMYHPPDLANGVDNELDEFIELQNITLTNVPLFDTFTNEAGYGMAAVTNTWQLRNAVDYDFPTNLALTANSRLLVVGFDPVANPTQLAAFRTLYSVPANVGVYGPWNGKMDNSGETIELKCPDKPDVTSTNVTVPFVMIDKVAYQDVSPWPTNADGLGSSLQRRVPGDYGNDPVNWAGALPTAGRINAFLPRPTITALTLWPSVHVSFVSAPGLACLLEYKDSLTDTDWIPIPLVVVGTGGVITLGDANSAAPHRFYRIRIQ
jgi:hypothetical protein